MESDTKSPKKFFNLETLPMKFAVTFFSAGVICIFPFLVLQMLLLGLSIREIALIYLINPVASLIGPILAGLIADKTGKFNYVLISSIVVATITSNLLLLVPPVDKTYVTSWINCNEDSNLTLNLINNCQDCFLNVDSNISSLVLKNCIPYCDEKSYCGSNCPNISQKLDVILSIRDAIHLPNSSCTMEVTNIRQTNLNFNSSQFCEVSETCQLKCEFKKLMENCEKETYYVISKSFIYFGILIFIASVFFSASFTMVDASLLTYVKQYHLEMGKQRIVIMIGFGLAPLLAGYLVDLYTRYTGIVSYLPTFILADIFLLFGSFIFSRIHLKVDLNESNIFKDLGKLVSRVEVDGFLFIVMVLGSNFGFIESYLFIYLKSLNAPAFLLGLTMTVGCLSSIPMLYYSQKVENKIGRQNVFLICFTAYAVRMAGYSFIKNPWMCLLFETLEAFTYQLLWVTCLNLCPLLAPKGLLATMTGVTGACHYSFGKAFGSFAGGLLIEAYGMRVAFRIFAGIALSGSLLYLLIHHTLLKKKIIERENQIKEEELRKEDEKKELVLT